MSFDALPDCETCGGERCLGCGYGCECNPCACDAPVPPAAWLAALAARRGAGNHQQSGLVHDERCCMEGIPPSKGPHPDCPGRPGPPPIVCLCGSTRFHEAFREARLRLTLQGEIVLTIGCDTASDGDLVAAGSLGQNFAQAKAALNELHKRKIDLADYVLVLNVGGYIGESTRTEIRYAESLRKPVRYLEQP